MKGLFMTRGKSRWVTTEDEFFQMVRRVLFSPRNRQAQLEPVRDHLRLQRYLRGR